MKAFAGSVEGDELRAILAGWSAQQNFVTNNGVANKSVDFKSHLASDW